MSAGNAPGSHVSSKFLPVRPRLYVSVCLGGVFALVRLALSCPASAVDENFFQSPGMGPAAHCSPEGAGKRKACLVCIKVAADPLQSNMKEAGTATIPLSPSGCPRVRASAPRVSI